MKTLRIATWNIERATPKLKRWKRIVTLIKAQQADIFVLTESQFEIAREIGLNHIETQDVSDRIHKTGEKWTMLLSHFPIEQIPTNADPDRAVAGCIKPPDHKPIIVYGTVLPWLGSTWREFRSAGGEAFVEALKEQKYDWKRLIDIYPDYDFVLAGDFNQNLGRDHFYGSHINRANLLSALNDCGLTCLTFGENDPVYKRTNGKTNWQLIDHICTNLRLASIVKDPRIVWPDGDLPDRTLSDHFGIAVDFSSS
jgi:endonuclease/exonuclease/phosphatase family metal-dependent hydrolase